MSETEIHIGKLFPVKKLEGESNEMVAKRLLEKHKIEND